MVPSVAAHFLGERFSALRKCDLISGGFCCAAHFDGYCVERRGGISGGGELTSGGFYGMAEHCVAGRNSASGSGKAALKKLPPISLPDQFARQTDWLQFL